MSENLTLVQAARRAVRGASAAQRRGLVVMALVCAVVSLFVAGLCVGRLVAGDLAGAAAGAPALLLLGVAVVAARALVDPGAGPH